MTSARDTLARIATLAAMVAVVAGLTQLFSPPHRSAPSIAQHTTATENPIATMSDKWSGEMNYAPSYAALNPYQSTDAEIVTSAFNPGDNYWGLPRSAGVETVAAYCAACHTLQIVMQQRQTREGWDYLLNWMVDKQGMAPPPDDTREEILNYLTREFPANGG